MAKALVVANWKMNPSSFKEAKKLFEATKRAAEGAKQSAVVVAPPALYLRELAANYRGKKISFAVQHAHFEAGGAYTGELSLPQAKDAKASYVLIGHAERRAMGETNDDTQKKVAAALALKLTPILCVGEKERKHDGEHYDIVREQLRASLAGVVPQKVNRVIITYEPLWTIGAKTAMNPRQMHEMAIFIRKTIVALHGAVGHSTKILYGGSIDAANAGAMLRDGDVRGFLVGRASITAVEFAALLQAIEDI
ncbi:MAG: triose-phosphate isomerase [Patescibacteria group bacterium]